jgi:hypothetical protein
VHKKTISLFFIIGVFFSAPLFSSGLDRKQTDTAGLFKRKCGICHTIDRPKSKRKTRAEWEATVKRMKQYADILTKEEEEVIVDYLSVNFGK